MLFLELLKWKSVILALFMSLLWQLSYAIGYNTPFWHETEGSYFVQYLNDERNRCKDEENYFFADRRNVYCYSFEDEAQTVCVSTEGTDKRIEDFAVWEDDVYYVTSLRSDDKEYIWEMCRIDYQSKEQEVVLTNEDFIRLNQEEVVEYAGVDVHKGYLFFYINRDNEYICPLGEDAGENSVKMLSLFDTEGTVGEIQQVEFDGITIEREVLSQGRYDIIGIWDEQGYKILYSGSDSRLKAGDEWIRFRDTNNRYGWHLFQYRTELDNPWRWKNISVFCKEKYKSSYMTDDYMTVEDGRIVGLLVVPEKWNGHKDLSQHFLKKTILFELDAETGESQILFDTRTNRTTIIGYKDKKLYYIKKEKIYVEDMENKEKTVLGEIPKGKDYIIDWQGGYLIIREDFSYGQNGDMVLVYKVKEESSTHQENYSEVSQEEKIEKYLLESVPEISDYATYIEKESDKEARLYIQIYEKEEVSVNGLESTINCYPVYVGEKWDTHTANWEWFYVSENMDAVYWYDVVDGEMIYSLEDWRNGDGYRTGAETKAEVETEPLQEEPSHNLKDVDWEAFQEKLSAEDAETLQRYLPVLTGGEFTWIDRQRDPDNADAYLHIPCQAVIQDIHLDCDQPDTLVSRIAFADVFQSGTQDVVLYLYNIGGHYLILHEENGVIYGIDYPVRWFQELQEDGLYCSSGGAGYQRFYRMTFANGDYTEHLICIWDEGDFYIGDEKQGTTNEEAWELFDAWYDTNMQNDVEWHSPF